MRRTAEQDYEIQRMGAEAERFFTDEVSETTSARLTDARDVAFVVRETEGR